MFSNLFMLSIFAGSFSSLIIRKCSKNSLFSKKLIDHQVATPEELKAIDDKVRTEMSEVERRALTDPELDVQEVYNNIFINPEPDFKIRGCDNFSYHIGK